MSRCLHLLENNSLAREINRMLAERLKNLYLENNCWTWTADYEWPEYESFYRVIQPIDKHEQRTSASLPLNYITRNFIRSPIKKMAKKALPASVKSYIKRTYNVE